MASKDVARADRGGSIIPKVVLFGLAALGAWIVLGWVLNIFSFVFNLAFWVVVLAVAVVVLWFSRKR